MGRSCSPPNLLVYSDPSNWSPAVVPNNTATTHYNVTIGARFIVGIDVDATISNLNLEGSVPGVNVTGRNFTVIGETTSALPTATIRVGSSSNAAARFNAGWLSTFSNGTLSGNYSVDSSGHPATLQFNGANISTLANGDVILQGPLARIEDEGGNDALRNLARIDSTASLWLGNNTVSTNAPFQNDGTLNIASSGGASLTAAAGLTNFDPTSRTITGGIFDLTGSSLRFNGADIVTIASSIHLYGTARIEDLAGNDGLRNLKHILPSGQFSLTRQSRAIASQFQNDGHLSLSEDSVLNVAGLSNFDSSARTLSGGTFVLSSHSQLRFAGADIVHNGAVIMLSLGGAIKDLTGADGLRNFNDNLASGEFVVGAALQFSPPGAFTNAGVVRTARAYFDRGLGFVLEGRLVVPAGFSYTQTSGSTVNDGYLAADRVDILGGAFSGLGTIKGNVTIQNATVSPSASMVFQGDLTLNSDAHFRYQFSFNEPQQITGKVTLGGTLEVDIQSGAFVSSTEVLTVLKSVSPIAGAFSNAPNGARIATVDGKGSVQVVYGTNAVFITGYLAEPPPSQLLNISSRAFLSRSDDDPFGDRAVLIGGFIIAGPAGPKDVVLRGLGPSLTGSGLTSVLADPILELRASNGDLLATNDNWKDTQANEIAATGLAPSDGREAALRITLQPGTYTVVIKEKNGLAGNGLVEIYDFSQNSDSKLANISTRGFTDSTNLLIGGIIAAGDGQANAEIVVRAIGPQLKSHGIFNALEDPTLELRDNNGSVVAFNDDWHANSNQLGSTGLAPSHNAESAMLVSLPLGNYTAIVRAKGESGGVALVEFYDLRP